MLKKGRVLIMLAVILLLAAGYWWWDQQSRPEAASSPATARQTARPDRSKDKTVKAKSMYLVKNLKGDIYGNREPEDITLYIKKDKNGFPLSLQVFINGQQRITEQLKEGYTMADCRVEGLDADRPGELLVYQCCTGSSGAMLLDVYRVSNNNTQLIYAIPEIPWDQCNSNERFETRYLGNYQVSFREKQSGLHAVVSLEKEIYAGREGQLSQLTTWVDPYSNYIFKDIDGDGVKEITAQASVIGLCHVDLVAHLNTIFNLENGKYEPLKQSLTTPPDVEGNSKTLVEVQL